MDNYKEDLKKITIHLWNATKNIKNTYRGIFAEKHLDKLKPGNR